jgi:hypothetical protein
MNLEEPTNNNEPKLNQSAQTQLAQQPLGGNAENGGHPFGEIEVWDPEAYGAAGNTFNPGHEDTDDNVERSRHVARRIGSAIMRIGGRVIEKIETLNDKDNVIDYLYEKSQIAQERQDIRRQNRQDKRDDHAETTDILLDRYLGFKYQKETLKREKQTDNVAHKEAVAAWRKNKKEQGISYRHYVRWVGGIAMNGVGLLGDMSFIIAQEQTGNLYDATKEKYSETKKKYKAKKNEGVSV